MEGDIPSTPSDDIVQARDVTPDVDDRPLEDAKSRECRFHKHLDTMFGDITFRKVLKVIKKSLNNRFKRVDDSVVVREAFLPSDLDGTSLNIEHARMTEMAEFELRCNRRIIVRHGLILLKLIFRIIRPLPSSLASKIHICVASPGTFT